MNKINCFKNIRMAIRFQIAKTILPLKKIFSSYRFFFFFFWRFGVWSAIEKGSSPHVSSYRGPWDPIPRDLWYTLASKPITRFSLNPPPILKWHRGPTVALLKQIQNKTRQKLRRKPYALKKARKKKAWQQNWQNKIQFSNSFYQHSINAVCLARK